MRKGGKTMSMRFKDYTAEAKAWRNLPFSYDFDFIVWKGELITVEDLTDMAFGC